MGAPDASKILYATHDVSFKIANSICSVPVSFNCIFPASSAAASKSASSFGEVSPRKGSISTTSDMPQYSRTSISIRSLSMPFSFNTLAATPGAALSPNKRCSLPTILCPIRMANLAALFNAFSASVVNCLLIMILHFDILHIGYKFRPLTCVHLHAIHFYKSPVLKSNPLSAPVPCVL